MFLPSLKIQCAWHLHPFSFTPVDGLSSNRKCRSLAYWPAKSRKWSSQIAQSFFLWKWDLVPTVLKSSYFLFYAFLSFRFFCRHYARTITLLEIFHQDWRQGSTLGNKPWSQLAPKFFMRFGHQNVSALRAKTFFLKISAVRTLFHQ